MPWPGGLGIGLMRSCHSCSSSSLTRHNALLDSCLCGVERVGDAVLLLADLHLAAAADLDHRDAARQLRQPLLQLLPGCTQRLYVTGLPKCPNIKQSANHEVTACQATP